MECGDEPLDCDDEADESEDHNLEEDDDDSEEQEEASSNVSELEDLVPPGLGFRIKTGFPSTCGFKTVVVVVMVVSATSDTRVATVAAF